MLITFKTTRLFRRNEKNVALHYNPRNSAHGHLSAFEHRSEMHAISTTTTQQQWLIESNIYLMAINLLAWHI